MEARLVQAALFVAALLSLGAGRPAHSVRSQHFIVSAPSPQLANEVCQAAEAMRRDLAIEWLGHELPPWQGICPISVKLDPGAGGATSFVFQGGVPTQWTMSVQGTRERILDSVLPHEITHTVFATHFGRPLPRWADEGGATTVEHVSEKTKQDHLLIRFLTTERGIAFHDMFKMKEYPQDILPLYSQGYSLARYFIEQGGKRKYVDYVGEGMRTNNWTATTRKYYGFESLSDLQVTWVNWVRQGSPGLAENPTLAATVARPAPPATQLASLSQPQQSRIPGGALASWQTVQAQNARAFGQAPPYGTADGSVNQNSPVATADTNLSTVSRPVSDGWYMKRRDQAQATLGSFGTTPTGTGPVGTEFSSQQSGSFAAPSAQSPSASGGHIPPPPTRSGASAGSHSDRRTLMEWTRPADRPFQGHSELAGIALQQPATMWR